MWKIRTRGWWVICACIRKSPDYRDCPYKLGTSGHPKWTEHWTQIQEIGFLNPSSDTDLWCDFGLVTSPMFPLPSFVCLVYLGCKLCRVGTVSHACVYIVAGTVGPRDVAGLQIIIPIFQVANWVREKLRGFRKASRKFWARSGIDL